MPPTDEHLEQAQRYDAAIADLQKRREEAVRSLLAAGAAYFTLMTAGAVGQVSHQPLKLRAGQFLLTLLFVGTFRFYGSTICKQSVDIADNAARRARLETTHGVPVREMLAYTRGARRWRRDAKRRAILAALPRYGASQRLAGVLLVLVAGLPAAWFALSQPRHSLMDAAVVAGTILAALVPLRLFFSGCRHWLWVDPQCLELRTTPDEDPVPAYGWWFYRLGSPHGPISWCVEWVHSRWWYDRNTFARRRAFNEQPCAERPSTSSAAPPSVTSLPDRSRE